MDGVLRKGTLRMRASGAGIRSEEPCGPTEKSLVLFKYKEKLWESFQIIMSQLQIYPFWFRLLNHENVATMDKNWKLSNWRNASCLACQRDNRVVSWRIWKTFPREKQLLVIICRISTDHLRTPNSWWSGWEMHQLQGDMWAMCFPGSVLHLTGNHFLCPLLTHSLEGWPLRVLSYHGYVLHPFAVCFFRLPWYLVWKEASDLGNYTVIHTLIVTSSTKTLS